MVKPRMNKKDTQWRGADGKFACGFVVAKFETPYTKTSRDSLYLCVTPEGKEVLIVGDELSTRIWQGSAGLQERGKYSCDFLNATTMQNGVVRLGEGISTIKVNCKVGEGGVNKYKAAYESTSAWRDMIKWASMKAERSWYATHDKMKEKAPAKKSGVLTMIGYGGEFKMPADVKKTLEEFKKAYPELVTKKALDATRASFDDELGSMLDFMCCYNVNFVTAVQQCYGTADIKAYPDDLLAFIEWRRKGSSVSDPHQWLQDGVVVKDKLTLAHLIGSMMVWIYCGDWTDPEFSVGTNAHKLLVETARDKGQLERAEKAFLALGKKPVWWRMALEAQISGAVFDRGEDGTAYGRTVEGRNFLEDDFLVKHKEYMGRCCIGGAQRKAYYPERYKESHPDLPASVPMKKTKVARMTDFVTRDDIDLSDKLENMLDSEISRRIYQKCLQKANFHRIENKVWELLNDKNEPFYFADYFNGLADDYEASDEQDKRQAELYNCDLIYMVAIAFVLGLRRPKSSGDIEIFGL